MARYDYVRPFSQAGERALSEGRHLEIKQALSWFRSVQQNYYDQTIMKMNGQIQPPSEPQLLLIGVIWQQLIHYKGLSKGVCRGLKTIQSYQISLASMKAAKKFLKVQHVKLLVQEISVKMLSQRRLCTVLLSTQVGMLTS